MIESIYSKLELAIRNIFSRKLNNFLYRAPREIPKMNWMQRRRNLTGRRAEMSRWPRLASSGSTAPPPCCLMNCETFENKEPTEFGEIQKFSRLANQVISIQ